MKISIIVPTHNRFQSLKNTIQSVVSLQDESFFELIIVDNNSTDNTANIAQEYYPFVKYIFEKNTAFSRARRTGANNASGDILLFLDDDVLVNKGSFKSIVEIFKNYTDLVRLKQQYAK
jgi:glycosyltransferase involved in cell wall biosynthesis